ncbi:Hypothetical predicted protein [Paramuricea clavata]|uniref:Uncharacterized protein n=1 Tax=Paramuricea clavata TaxID=317549 RepID=A0A7D9L182_PARCT|nr:Hypothetical predicted protein [Paramuricea clavata]
MWEKKDGDGKGSGIHHFTSLMGSDKKLLLRTLPDKLPGVIRPETSATVVKLWKDFDELYKILGCQNPTDQQITNYFAKAVEWITFLSLSGKAMGYEKERITPYMHTMVYHMPKFMEVHKGINKFTGQESGTSSRMRENTQKIPKAECVSFWESNIKDTRAKHVRLSGEIVEDVQAPFPFDIYTLTAHQIKDKLKEIGVTTQLRCLKKLKKLLIETMSNKENKLPN